MDKEQSRLALLDRSRSPTQGWGGSPPPSPSSLAFPSNGGWPPSPSLSSSAFHLLLNQRWGHPSVGPRPHPRRPYPVVGYGSTLPVTGFPSPPFVGVVVGFPTNGAVVAFRHWVIGWCGSGCWVVAGLACRCWVVVRCYSSSLGCMLDHPSLGQLFIVGVGATVGRWGVVTSVGVGAGLLSLVVGRGSAAMSPSSCRQLGWIGGERN